MEYFLIIISAIFVNNIVLAQFLGICPFWEYQARFQPPVWYSRVFVIAATVALICLTNIS